MKRFVVVALACMALVVSVLLHKYAIGVTVGIVAGAWYFLRAVVRGGGIATARITHDPGQPRKPGDPDGSIGMGLAASGIAAAVLGSPDYAPYRGYFNVFFAAGLLIALSYAINGLVTEYRIRRDQAGDKPGSAV